MATSVQGCWHCTYFRIITIFLSNLQIDYLNKNFGFIVTVEWSILFQSNHSCFCFCFSFFSFLWEHPFWISVVYCWGWSYPKEDTNDHNLSLSMVLKYTETLFRYRTDCHSIVMTLHDMSSIHSMQHVSVHWWHRGGARLASKPSIVVWVQNKDRKRKTKKRKYVEEMVHCTNHNLYKMLLQSLLSVEKEKY